LVALVTSALAFVCTRVRADNALDIQSEPNYTSVTFNGIGDEQNSGNGHDAIVDDILTVPGTFGGEQYATYMVLAADASGGLLLWSYPSEGIWPATYAPTVGDNISLTGTYQSYHSIPAIRTVTAVSLPNTGLNGWQSPGVGSGQVGGGSQLVTIPNVLANPGNPGDSQNLPINQAYEGYLVEIQNVTISGAGTLTTWPTTNAGTSGLNNLYLTDTAGNSMTLYFWYSSVGVDGNMVGAPIPDNSSLTSGGEFDVYGFLAAYPSVTGGHTIWQDELDPTAFVATVPEPSSFMLAGVGLLGLLAIIRRRHS